MLLIQRLANVYLAGRVNLHSFTTVVLTTVVTVSRMVSL